MPYLIDGHNLIPKVPGLSLQALDDEMQLVDLLGQFCRKQRKQVEVFFDNAPPGGQRLRSFGMVTARFVRQGVTADQAIQNRLRLLGKAARNWIVVSSDQAVQFAARQAQARCLASEAFVALLQETLDETRKDTGENAEVQMRPDELDEWMNLFGSGGNKSD